MFNVTLGGLFIHSPLLKKPDVLISTAHVIFSGMVFVLTYWLFFWHLRKVNAIAPLMISFAAEVETSGFFATVDSSASITFYTVSMRV